MEVDAYLRRRYEGKIADIQIVEKEDLDLVSPCIMLYVCLSIVFFPMLADDTYLSCYFE